jgi:cellulose synthase/poly-beta-1,6-N-acetylglucosamine synthase-like glycosyltransferase
MARSFPTEHDVIIIESITWLAIGLIVYVFVGYPLAVWLLARLRPWPVARADITPAVTLLVSAFNEASVIGRKIENSLALDYPHERLEIIVISDASTDATDEIVHSFEGRGVTLLRMAERGGKTLGLNAAVAWARGEVIVFSDANILYAPDALRKLVRNFADPAVGCVTGDSRYDEAPNSAAHREEDTYWGYERFIRTYESRIGSTVGGDGAIFAIRRELYRPLAADAINDFVVPLRIVLEGHRAVFEPAAIGVEPSAGSFKREFRRKRRIVNRSWRAIMGLRGILSPWRSGLFAWQVWSHKVLRWLMLPLVVAAGAGSVLAYDAGLVYQLGAWGFGASLTLAAIGGIMQERSNGLGRLVHTAYYFYVVNVAAMLGIISAFGGRIETTWVPER